MFMDMSGLLLLIVDDRGGHNPYIAPSTGDLEEPDFSNILLDQQSGHFLRQSLKPAFYR